MIATIGHAAILVGLGLSAYAVAGFVLGRRGGDPSLASSSRRAVGLSFAAAGIAVAALTISLLTHDFSVRYVANNNATSTPPFISAISLWAALEGSILFWTLLATGWATLALWRHRGRRPEMMAWVGATLASVNLFFFAVMAWPGNPFLRVLPAGVEGNGPNALLQNHPFMALHPPLLYLGYTGLAVPFAFGVAALVTRRLDEEWLRIVRRWTLVPWTFLTLGIVAGAWWSYEVLGWGGYWLWDPVENAALLPWLTATAFIHSAMVAERRGSLRIWTVLLVVSTFVLTIVGTFLTRSGVVESVHAFTQSAIGPWFLAAIVVSMSVGLGLIVWRLPELSGGGRPSRTVSRESAFLLNNVLFLVLAVVVLFGTLLPLVFSVTTGETIGLGAPWFNRVNVPIAALLLLLMGVGPALPWGTASWSTVRRRFALPVIAAVAVVVGARGFGLAQPTTLLTLGLATFVAWVLGDEIARGARARAEARSENAPIAVWRLATRNRRRYGGYAVHLGICVMAVGIAVSSGLASETTMTLAPGQSARLGGYSITNQRLTVEPLASDVRVTETRAEVGFSGPQSGTLATALRDYPNSASAIATPAVRTSLSEDLYVTLLSADPASGTVTLQVFINPLVVWIWIGGALVAASAVFAMWPERRLSPATVTGRVPVPREATVEPASEGAQG
jgi:cytochrome c-type biogenesis protein CcmF